MVTINSWREGQGKDKLGAWDGHVHIAIFKIDNQQGPGIKSKQRISVTWEGLGEVITYKWILHDEKEAAMCLEYPAANSMA